MNISRCWTADFETTTDINDCRVWAYSLCNIDDYTDFRYGNNIDDFFDFCANPKENYKIWIHNLKFDGIYLLNYLFLNGFKYIEDRKDRADNTFTTLITDQGQFYSITVYFKIKNHHTNKVEFFDSLKIFPNFSVEKMAEAFNLPISKLEIDYRKYRPINHRLTPKEIAYIRNDVEIVSRALKEMFTRGLTKMTIASNAMTNFKDHFIGFRKKFPILSAEIDADIRNAYRGGFTYANETWQGKEVGRGIVLDVNSLYPSCQASPNKLPYGQPQTFEGEYQEDDCFPLYFQILTCSFDIKPGKLPTIQLKNTLSFMPHEYVKSSNNKRVTLTLTRPDFELFKSHYDIHNPVYHGGYKFKAATGYFDNYINYWTEQKIKATKEKNAPLRAISKLMLNSLYGRLAVSGKARSKMPYFEDDVVKFTTLPPKERELCYLPAAAYITALGRFKTITTAQIIRDYTLQKYGEDRLYYNDTDSCHGNLSDEDLEELKDIIQIDDYKLGCWAKEAEFTRAKFLRSKCYIEEVDGKLNVAVAGLPKYLAPLITFDNFSKGFSTAGLTKEDMVKLAKENGASKEEIKKLQHKLTYKYVKGGVVLVDTDFTIK